MYSDCDHDGHTDICTVTVTMSKTDLHRHTDFSTMTAIMMSKTDHDVHPDICTVTVTMGKSDHDGHTDIVDTQLSHDVLLLLHLLL